MLPKYPALKAMVNLTKEILSDSSKTQESAFLFSFNFFWVIQKIFGGLFF